MLKARVSILHLLQAKLHWACTHVVSNQLKASWLRGARKAAVPVHLAHLPAWNRVTFDRQSKTRML